MARMAHRRLEAALARLQPVDTSLTSPVAGGIDDLLETIESAAIEARSQLSAAESLAAQLRGALDVVNVGVVICDERGEEVYRNAGAENQGATRHGDVIAEQAVADQLAAACQGEEREQMVELFSPARRNLLIRAFTLRGLDRSLGAVAIVEDVSERRRLEAVRRDFVANVSHELKTPVGALSLLAETLDGEDDPEVITRLSARVATEAVRLGQIIDDLLDLSRIEANEAPERELLALQLVLEEALDPLRGVAASRDITLEVGLPQHLVVPGDRRDLVSAVANLVDNAIKYSESGSRVEVSVEVVPEPRGGDAPLNPTAGRWVAVRVSDQGMGIPARDLQRVFERFYRVDRARSRTTGGTGLGLSIVRHVAANHGGCIDVQSIEGSGSTFTLYLPAGPASSTGEVTDG